MDDPECVQCFQEPDGGECGGDIGYCSDLVDFYCCYMTEDSCSHNAAVVAYLGKWVITRSSLILRLRIRRMDLEGRAPLICAVVEKPRTPVQLGTTVCS